MKTKRTPQQIAFIRGYICAVANYVQSYGRDSKADEMLRAISIPEDITEIDEFDREILQTAGMIPKPKRKRTRRSAKASNRLHPLLILTAALLLHAGSAPAAALTVPVDNTGYLVLASDPACLLVTSNSQVAAPEQPGQGLTISNHYSIERGKVIHRFTNTEGSITLSNGGPYVSLRISTNAHWRTVKVSPSNYGCLVQGCTANHSEMRDEVEDRWRITQAEVVHLGKTNLFVLETEPIAGKPQRRTQVSGIDYTLNPPQPQQWFIRNISTNLAW